ncbi:hypothetical protein [Sphingobacterium suaedae]|uniref:Uncharacterized protein n=1 Tax=Sphingobacterium suaedae TaxID=1686402 RepID=A0ABW5KBV1_9SPHI
MPKVNFDLLLTPERLGDILKCKYLYHNSKHGWNISIKILLKAILQGLIKTNLHLQHAVYHEQRMLEGVAHCFVSIAHTFVDITCMQCDKQLTFVRSAPMIRARTAYVGE